MELESLRQQDQQRMKELQRTLTELERQEKEMAAQRLSGWTSGPQRKAPAAPPEHSDPQADWGLTGISQQQQVSSSFLPGIN